MGFRISWIATEASEENVLAALDAVKTGETDAYPDFDLCVVTAKPGWTVIWSNDEVFFDDARCMALSREFPLLGVHVNETVMYSDARWFDGGGLVWKIWHEGDEDPAHLARIGPLPDQAAEIEQAKRAEQKRDDEANPGDGVDIIFEIPLALAASYCGFKHDEFEGTEDSCKELQSQLVTKKPRSFLARLFGG
jgi:hypothetical protein